MTVTVSDIARITATPDGWLIEGAAIQSTDELGDALWPMLPTLPYGVEIVVGDPGQFLIRGLDDDGMAAMDEAFFRRFVDAGYHYDPTPRPRHGEYWLVDAAGTPLQHVQPVAASPSGDIDPFGDTTKLALQAARVTSPGLFALVDIAHSAGYSVAFGIDADLAILLGISAGGGIYFGTEGDVGLYASLGTDLGIIATASIGITGIAVEGPSSRFAGWSYAVEVSGGEIVSLGGSLLYDNSGQYLGFAAEIGVGVGLPVNVFASASHTWLRQF